MRGRGGNEAGSYRGIPFVTQRGGAPRTLNHTPVRFSPFARARPDASFGAMRTATPRAALLAPTFLVALSLSACTNQSSSEAHGSGRRSGGASDDVSALQGRWEQLPDQPGGSDSPRQRVVKEVSGNNETVTTYGPNGQVLRAQTATFRLSRSGPVRVYTVQNPKITAGEGDATRRSMAFVYRVHGSEFDEVWGLLPGQEEREVVVKRWRREGAEK